LTRSRKCVILGPLPPPRFSVRFKELEMPTYELKNVTTGEIKEMFLSISEMEEKIKSGEWITHFSSTPKIVSHHGSIIGKTSGDWRDVLKKIKKGSDKTNTINV
jgi:hypothetical protein